MRRRAPLQPEAARPGFALLMALVLVALAAVALAGVASRSLTAAVEARSSIERVQRRWATRTARSTLLAHAHHVFLDAELPPEQETEAQRLRRLREARFEPLTQITIDARLAGQDYRFVLTDEQTRINVNTLLSAERADLEDAAERVESLVTESGTFPARLVELRPRFSEGSEPVSSPQEPSDPVPPAIVSFAQVFPDASPAALLGDERRPGPATRVTCWGEKINFRRAPEAVVETACHDVLNGPAIRDLIDARRARPAESLDRVLRGLSRLDGEAIDAVNARLGETSNAFGLWVLAQDPLRTRHSFAVRSTDRRPTFTSPSDTPAGGRRNDLVSEAGSDPGRGNIHPVRTFVW